MRIKKLAIRRHFSLSLPVSSKLNSSLLNIIVCLVQNQWEERGLRHLHGSADWQCGHLHLWNSATLFQGKGTVNAIGVTQGTVNATVVGTVVCHGAGCRERGDKLELRERCLDWRIVCRKYDSCLKQQESAAPLRLYSV